MNWKTQCYDLFQQYTEILETFRNTLEEFEGGSNIFFQLTMHIRKLGTAVGLQYGNQKIPVC